MITSLDHIHLYTRDVQSTIRFYESCFGGEYLGKIPSKSGDGNHGVLLGGQLLVISTFPPGMAPATPPEPGDGALQVGFGVAHFGLQTKDLDDVVARLEAAGAHVHAPPARTGSIRYVYATAPDGVVVELVELHLPPKLARLSPLLDGVNKVMHVTRRALVSQLFER